MVVTRSQKKTMSDPTSASISNNGELDEKEASPASASTSQVEETKSPVSTNTSNDKFAEDPIKDDEPKTPMITIVCLSIIAAVSYLTFPDSLQPVGRPTLQHVWYFGWISALSTGLGVLPLIFSPKLDTWWIGVTNGECLFTFLINKGLEHDTSCFFSQVITACTNAKICPHQLLLPV